MTDLSTFSNSAKGLARNPLGIIALFIVLIYGFASLVTAFAGSLQPSERVPLVYFLVLFPVLVLGVFAWLVSSHAAKLYSPGDFKNEENYVALVASIAVASANRPDGQGVGANVDIPRITKTVQAVAPRANSTAPKHVLWVDDRPDNNIYERRAFETLGIKFTLALSTSQAIEFLARDQFAAIISDMGRAEGPHEGYVLLDQIRRSGNKTPFFIYAGSNLAEHKAEAARHGAQGSTNVPEDLVEMVTAAVSKGGGGGGGGGW